MGEDMNDAKVMLIPIDKIKPNLWNPNVMMDDMVAHLVKEYHRIGYLQPILVRPLGDMFEIIDGEHRWSVAKEVGMKELTCVVKPMSDEDAKLTTINMGKIKGSEDPVQACRPVAGPQHNVRQGVPQRTREHTRERVGDNVQPERYSKRLS